MSAALDLTPEQRAERVRKQKRDWARRHRERVNYDNRVRYHSSKKLRDARRKRQKRRRANPEARARDSERLSARVQRAALRASRWGFAAFHHLRTITLAQLEHPRYFVHSPGRRRLVEQWPIKDDAARWLATHARPDTKPPLLS